MRVAILAIGNEVLCGKIINTNSAFIAREIEKLGAKVVHHQVVADSENDIVKGLDYAYTYADLVLTIGGLGPTLDDLTRHGVAKYFDESLVFDEKIYQGIHDYFVRVKKEMPRNNERQAYRLKDGVVIPNPNGTAPGLFFKVDNREIFLLPGPPNELKPMVFEYVLTYLVDQIGQPQISRSYRLYGIGESFAEEKLMVLYKKYPMLNIAPYCSISYVDYVVTTSQKYEEQLMTFEEQFLAIFSDHYGGDQSTKLNEEIIRLLGKKGLTLSTVESCTGGLLASELVNVVGASSVFLEGMITYSNESKIKRLGVNQAVIAEHGAVSEQTAKQMSQSLQSLTETDVAIAITGIAGPKGGTKLKPVGLTYISVTIGDKTLVKSYIFNGNREKIRERATTQALFLLYCEIK